MLTSHPVSLDKQAEKNRENKTNSATQLDMQEHCVSTPVKSSITPDKVIMQTSVEFKSTPVNMDTSLTDTGDEEIATQTLSNNISDTDSATEIHPE